MLWIKPSYRCSYSSGKGQNLPSTPWLHSLQQLSISNHGYTLLCFLWPKCFEASWGRKEKKKKKDLEPSLLSPTTSLHYCLLCAFNTNLNSCLGCLLSHSGKMKTVLISALVFHTCSAAIYSLQPLCRDNFLC